MAACIRASGQDEAAASTMYTMLNHVSREAHAIIVHTTLAVLTRLARDVIQHRVHRRRRRLVLPRGADARRHARRRQVRVRIERRDRRRRLHPPPDVVQQLERERRTHMREDRGAFERCALRRHIVRRRSLAQHVTARPTRTSRRPCASPHPR